MPPRISLELFNARSDTLAAALVNPPEMGFVGEELVFGAPYDLVGLTLSSSLLNFGTDIMGVFVVIGADRNKLTFSKGTKAVLGHVSFQNSFPGPPAVPIPTNKSTPLPLPYPLRIETGRTIRLYAFGDNTAGNRVTAYLSVQVAPVL